MELARDCLQKSQEKMISGAYFYEMTENLEKLLLDVSLMVYSVYKINTNPLSETCNCSHGPISFRCLVT